MIRDGNYYWLNYDEYRPKVIEVATQFFGEQYRDIITTSINKTHYYPYHTLDYVQEYYYYQMKKYRREILDKFYAITGLEPTLEREALLFPSDNQISVEMALASDYDLSNYSQKQADILRDIRVIVYDDFDIHGSLEDKYNKLKEYFDIFKSILYDMELKHPCQVFRDIRNFRKNNAKSYNQFLLHLRSIGVDISDRDIERTSDSKNFNPEDLDCNYLLYTLSLEDEGMIWAFGSRAEEKLLTGSIEEKKDIIINRLRYLNRYGVKFKYVDSDYLFSSCVSLPKLMLEYFHQCRVLPKDSHFGYTPKTDKEGNTEYADISHGEFVPRKLADQVEEYRRRYMYDKYLGCQFMSRVMGNIEDSGFGDNTYINYNLFKRNMADGKQSEICFCEDGDVEDDFMESAFIHENAHSMFRHICKSYTGNYYISKWGLEIIRYNIKNSKLSGYNQITDDNMEELYENFHERISREMYELFKYLYGDTPFFSQDEIKRAYNDYSTYRLSNQVTDQFYDEYYREIREQFINPEYSIFRGVNYGVTPAERLINFARLKIGLLTDNPVSDGLIDRISGKSQEVRTVDYSLMQKLAIINKEFKEILSLYGRKITLQEVEDYHSSSIISEEDKVRLDELIAKKDRLMSQIISESTKDENTREK